MYTPGPKKKKKKMGHAQNGKIVLKWSKNKLGQEIIKN